MKNQALFFLLLLAPALFFGCGNASLSVGGLPSTAGYNQTTFPAPSPSPYYSAVIMADGPIAYWRFNDSGTIAADRSGNDYSGTYKGGQIFEAGPISNDPIHEAAVFTGSNVFKINSSSGALFTSAYPNLSVEVWLNIPSAQTPQSQPLTIFDRATWDDTDGFGVGIGNVSGHALFGHYGDWVESSIDVCDGKWHHIVGTIAPSGNNHIYNIYVDGVLDNYGGSPTTSPYGITSSSPSVTTYDPNAGANLTDTYGGQLAIGYEPSDLSSGIVGTLAELAVYAITLSPSQVANHYSASGL